MSQVVDFFNEAKVYYVATIEGHKPKVRPFGATVAYKGRVYLTTNNQKDVFKQLLKNPHIAVSAMAGDKWIRVTGTAVFDYRSGAKEAMLTANPILKQKHTVEDSSFEVFYIDDMKATIYSFNEPPIELEN